MNNKIKKLSNEKKVFNTKLIEDFMSKNSTSKTKFCSMCRISPKTFDKIYNNDLNVGILSIYKITKTMKIHFFEIFCDNQNDKQV